MFTYFLDSYLAEVLELVQEIASAGSCNLIFLAKRTYRSQVSQNSIFFHLEA